MPWRVIVDPAAVKQLLRLPGKDRTRMRSVLAEMGVNPFRGDIKKMKGEDSVWRRRVGAYRIKYELRTSEDIVYVFDIERRSSNTY